MTISPQPAAPPRVGAFTSDRPPAVVTRSLTKLYGGAAAIADLDLWVPEGGIYGFLGPNGAGKSTTMKVLLGVTRPSSGEAFVLGTPLGGRSRVAPGRVGSLIEGPAFYPNLTGRENLAMIASYLRLPDACVAHALGTVGLGDDGKKLAKHYSLGMKQRLGIAMALLSEPSLLLLDEPTNGLDPAGVAEIRQLIVTLARERGVTIIVSSHVLSEIEQMADTVAIINAGRLRYQGPLAGLRDDGVLEFGTADPARLMAVLSAHGVATSVHEGAIRTPLLPDEIVSRIIADAVGAGSQLHRVQTVRKTLEQAFLELTDPLGGTQQREEAGRELRRA